MEPRTYPPGVPSWIDTEQPDDAAARTFYGDLFGWTFENAMPADAPGSYWIAQLDGRDVAAVAPAGGSTATWNTYIAVDDADRTAEAAAAAGGRITDAPVDAGPGGRWAGLVDPAGAAFRLWQARRRPGAQTVNAPGSWNFSDLHTSDARGAATFYGDMFGWVAADLGFATMWRRPGYGEHLAATIDPSILERQEGVGAPPGFADCVAWLAPLGDGEAPHWHVSFTVDDRDDAMATALRLGATDLSGPVDTEWTKSVTIRDPQGAVLTLSQFDPQSS